MPDKHEPEKTLLYVAAGLSIIAAVLDIVVANGSDKGIGIVTDDAQNWPNGITASSDTVPPPPHGIAATAGGSARFKPGSAVTITICLNQAVSGPGKVDVALVYSVTSNGQTIADTSVFSDVGSHRHVEFNSATGQCKPFTLHVRTDAPAAHVMVCASANAHAVCTSFDIVVP